jgi:hypothetical protein
MPNVDALLYAAKVARAPYLLPAGPEVVALAVSASRAVTTQSSATSAAGAGSAALDVQITAELDDGLTGGQAIVAAEATIDTPPWDGGSPTALAASDGAFDTAQETVSGTLSLDGPGLGRHLIFVRGQDAAGDWGPSASKFITVTHVAQSGADRPGAKVLYAFQVLNTGYLSRSLTLTSTPAHWLTSVVPLSVTQSPGAVTPVTVTVTIPITVGVGSSGDPQQPAGLRDVVTVTARSAEAPWLSYDVRLETVALWASAFLPLVMRH